MNQRVLTAIAVAAACAATPAPAQQQPLSGKPLSAHQRYDMSYVSSDDRVQAFDDGKVTRLLLPEGTLIPMVVSIKPQGEVLLPMLKELPYLLVDGLHGQLVLNWANQRKVTITYRGQLALEKRTGQGAAFGSVPITASFGTIGRPTEATPTVMLPKPASGSPGEVAGLPAAPMASGGQQPGSGTYEVTAADRNMRQVLVRWAKAAGWEHSPEHWTVPWDVSIGGVETYNTDFRTAARALLASTKISSVSGVTLQPCFYSNRVLRVIPEAEPCDRSAEAKTSFSN